MVQTTGYTQDQEGRTASARKHLKVSSGEKNPTLSGETEINLYKNDGKTKSIQKELKHYLSNMLEAALWACMAASGTLPLKDGVTADKAAQS